jgi:hypothetical protein
MLACSCMRTTVEITDAQHLALVALALGSPEFQRK